VPAVEDVHYPDEEPAEAAAGGLAPSVVQSSVAGQWAVLADRNGGGSGQANVTVGGAAFGFVLLAVLDVDAGGAVAVVERSFARWGFLAYVRDDAGGGGEVARLRKATGAVAGLTMPNYARLDAGYYARVASQPDDWLAGRVTGDVPDGEATFLAAAKYLPPQRDYASIGGMAPYQKWSVSPDGRIKSADLDIYTPADAANATGPGALVYDPRWYLPGVPPSQPNFTFTKSGLVGGHLRVVATVAYEPTTGAGYEQLAFAPASEPSASAYVRLRGTSGPEAPPFAYTYVNASLNTSRPLPLAPAAFYTALLAEQAGWNATFAGAAAFTLPGREGARQVDTTLGGLVASLSLFIGPQPNYGDGGDYWSPQVSRGGSLPFQEIAVVQSLLDLGLPALASERLGWWMDHYVNVTDGTISFAGWEPSCPFGGFADGLADYGEMQDIFARTARSQLGYNGTGGGAAWVAAHLPQAVALANYSLGLRVAAKANTTAPTAGLVWGPPEHDTCHTPDFYYHNNAWFVRGMLEMGRLLTAICPALCPPGLAGFGATLTAEAAAFQADVLASIAATATTLPGGLVFIPPVARVGVAPFGSMVESVLSEYSNFRYYSELLGADVLPPDLAGGLQAFREATTGTVSGITRWSDHLDDMPSSYYAAAALWADRLPRFFLLQYGHMANYMGRGTWTATEQLPIGPDANGFWRDYLWSYLEGGIDECVPSIMLPAIATRWQLVHERYDTNTLWLAKGAPRRWADPAGGGYGVARAATRFGLVDVHVAFAANATGGGQTATATVGFTPAGVPGVTPAPTFALRLRSASPALAILPSSVAVTGVSGGGVVLDSVNATGGYVYLSVPTPPGVGVQLRFTVTADLA
jgi:hypothetical protein